jgi:hypothetical protein
MKEGHRLWTEDELIYLNCSCKILRANGMKEFVLHLFRWCSHR